jgi:hypothetical protein
MAGGDTADAGAGGKARSNQAASNKRRSAASEVTGQGDGGDQGQGSAGSARRVRTYWHVYRLAYTRT